MTAGNDALLAPVEAARRDADAARAEVERLQRDLAATDDQLVALDRIEEPDDETALAELKAQKRKRSLTTKLDNAQRARVAADEQLAQIERAYDGARFQQDRVKHEGDCLALHAVLTDWVQTMLAPRVAEVVRCGDELRRLDYRLHGRGDLLWSSIVSDGPVSPTSLAEVFERALRVAVQRELHPDPVVHIHPSPPEHPLASKIRGRKRREVEDVDSSKSVCEYNPFGGQE